MKWKLNLQHFADEENQTDEVQEDNTDDTEEEKKLTQEEFNKALSKRLEKERDKMKREMESALKKEREEAEKKAKEAEELAKLSEKERAEHEFKKEREKFEEERKQFQREKLKLETTKDLQSRGLPTDFAEYVLGEDDQTTFDNIKQFEEVWKRSIEEAVNEKLKGTTPQKPGYKKASLTQEQFDKMGYTQRLKVKQDYPDLYKQFTEG